MDDLLYRPNVCIAIQQCGTNKLLTCHRIGCSAETGWQFPQGGIESGSDIIVEMKRELREEIGTDDVRVVAISPFSYTYTLPSGQINRYPKFKGQIQQWVHVEFCGKDSEIHFSYEPAEFDAFTWLSPSIILQRIVGFKYDVYRKALHDLGLLV